MPALPIAEYPGVPMTDGPETVRAKVERLIDAIVDGLARPVETALTRAVEPAARDVVFRGTLDQVQEFFYARLWTDGLPVIPPTIPRVERFLEFADRSPAEVIGTLSPENRAATVWSIAVNGVMAGCRPEYMPLLIAVVEAIAEPEFRVQDAGSTPGWEPLIIVSGAVAKALDFNRGQGVMRVGRQANTSLGRFLRLYLRNVAGLRIPPGAGDKGSIAATFNVALAEDEDAAAEIGWTTFGQDQGFAKDDGAVTVQSVVSSSPPISLKALAESGALPPEYAGSGDPDRPVRVFPRAAWIGIVVAGDPGRNQSKGYVNNHIQGGRVSKRLALRL